MDRDHTGPSPAVVATYRSRRARLRLGRRLVPLVLAAAALCLLVSWQRDARHIEVARARLEPYIGPLDRYLRENGTLPLVYPQYPGQAVSMASGEFTYVGTDVVAWARSANRAVVIGWDAGNSLIGRNGHAVVMYDGGAVRADWLSTRDLGLVLADYAVLEPSPPAD